jgi:hypothetical protein
MVLVFLLQATVFAQTIPKPSVPEFTVRIVDNSYDVPPTTPTYTIDPYSGQQKEATSGSSGYHVEDKSIEFTIKNQPFTPYTNSAGFHVALYYNFRFKGHFGNEAEWSYDPFENNGISSRVYGGWDMTELVPYEASNSEYTIVTPKLYDIPDYGSVDFQVQAQIGYILPMGNSFMARVFYIHYNFTGESSDWSNTQTLSLDDNSVSSPTVTTTPTTTLTLPSQAPTATPTPQIPVDSGSLFNLTSEQAALAVAVVVIAVLAVAVVVLWRKKVRPEKAMGEGLVAT